MNLFTTYFLPLFCIMSSTATVIKPKNITHATASTTHNTQELQIQFRTETCRVVLPGW